MSTLSNLPRLSTYKGTGPVRMLFIDDTNDRAYALPQVDNVHLVEGDPQVVRNRGIWEGRMVTLGGIETNYELFLSGMFVEIEDPDTTYLFMKNCGTPVNSDCGLIEAVEVYKAFKYSVIDLVHRNGFFGTGALPAAQNPEASAFGSGGSITPRDYHIIIVPYYGNSPGAPVEDTVTIASGELFALIWDAPIGGAPTEYRIYTYNDGQTSDDGILRAIVGGDVTGWSSDEFLNLGSYPGDATGSFSIINDDTLEVYDAGTDYIVDTLCAKIQIPTTTTIPDGASVRITYSWRAAASVSMSIGPAQYNPLYMHVQLVSMRDSDQNPPSAEGRITDLWKVLVTRQWDLDESGLNFEKGFTFNWEVIYDEYNGDHGRRVLYNKHNYTYDILRPGDISKFHNLTPCGNES